MITDSSPLEHCLFAPSALPSDNTSRGRIGTKTPVDSVQVPFDTAGVSQVSATDGSAVRADESKPDDGRQSGNARAGSSDGTARTTQRDEISLIARDALAYVVCVYITGVAIQFFVGRLW